VEDEIAAIWAATDARNVRDARADFQEFAASVRNMCALAGMAEIGADLIVSCRTLGEARAAIIDRRAEADEALQISPLHGSPQRAWAIVIQVFERLVP